MKTELVVVTDLGHMKAFELARNHSGRSPRLMPRMSLDVSDSLKRPSELLSDSAGMFGGRMDSVHGVMGKGSGERHEMARENERRAIKRLASTIEDLLAETGCAIWNLAAPEAINHRILEAMDPANSRRLALNLKADLVKSRDTEILDRFTASA